MCGRFVLTKPVGKLAAHFEVPELELRPRYNVAPTQSVAAVRVSEAGRELVTLRWGLGLPDKTHKRS